jgi:hypothetical protein
LAIYQAPARNGATGPAETELLLPPSRALSPTYRESLSVPAVPAVSDPADTTTAVPPVTLPATTPASQLLHDPVAEVAPARWSSFIAAGWRSRCVATVAYLMTLGALVAVAQTGGQGSVKVPVAQSSDNRVTLAGSLVDVVAGAMAAPSLPSPASPVAVSPITGN